MELVGSSWCVMCDGFTSTPPATKLRDTFNGNGGGGGGGLIITWLCAAGGEHVDDDTIGVAAGGAPGSRKSPLEIGCWMTG